MTELEVLIEIRDYLQVIAIFAMAHFGWYIYRAFIGGWFRLDRA